MTISKLTNPPSQKGVIDKVNEIIDSIGGSGGSVSSVNGQTGDVTLTASDVGALPDSTVIPTVDQTYSASSTNAQSGVAIAGAGFIQNTATGTNALTIGGTAATSNYATNIGSDSQAGTRGTAIGRLASATGQRALALGFYSTASAQNAIQLGYGTNSTASTLAVGFNNTNYELLDGTTGLIPDARLSSNIARTSDIPTDTNELTNSAGFITSSALSPYALSANLATVATSGSYNDLSDKPTIPTVNNATLTIQKNGTTVNSFTANASSDVTANITVPTKTSDLTNDDGFITGITSGDVTTALGYTPANDSNVLHTTGNETFSGWKSVSSGGIVAGPNNLHTVQIIAGTGRIQLTSAIGNVELKAANGHLNVDNGVTGTFYQVIDASDLATTSSAGIVQPDGSTITVNNGVISATPARNIGEIVQSTIPLTDAGLHLLDGALINGSGSYADFVTYIAGLVSTYPDLFITESDWQTAVTTYGVCGKFVYDSTNNTVRLPKITGIIEGTTDLTALGDLVEAGLPNITGDISTYYRIQAASGAFNPYGTGDNGGDAGNYGYRGATFDASRSSSIYGNSSTVQPQTIKAFYYIVIANSTKTDIQVDIDEIATDLNGKADRDLSNLTNGLSNTICTTTATTTSTATNVRPAVVVENYVNGTSWYRVWSDGWKEQGGVVDMPSIAWYQVTFLKAFSNTNYCCVGSQSTTSTSYSYTNAEFLCSRTSNTYMNISLYSNTGTAQWYACGY